MPLAETLAPSADGALPILTEEERRRRLAIALGLAPPMPAAAQVPVAGDGSRGIGIEPIPNAMPGDARVEPIPNAVPGEARMEPLVSPAYSPGPRMSSAPVPESQYPGPDGNVAPELNPADMWPDPYRDRFGTPRPSAAQAPKPDPTDPAGLAGGPAAEPGAQLEHSMTATPYNGTIPGANDGRVDRPSGWKRFANALGAAGMALLNNEGILGAGRAAIQGARPSQHGPGALGRYGDVLEDNEAAYEAQQQIARAAPVYAQQTHDAKIKDYESEAQSRAQRDAIARGKYVLDLEEAARKGPEAVQEVAREEAARRLAQGEDVDEVLAKAAGYSGPIKAKEEKAHFGAVANAAGAYIFNTTTGDDVRQLDVPIKQEAGDRNDDIEAQLRQKHGDPEADIPNPEFEQWRKTIGERKAFAKAMYGLMTPQEKEPGFVPPADFEATLQQRWNTLPEAEKGVYYDQVQGAPKRRIKQKDKPGFAAQWEKDKLEMRRAARPKGLGSAKAAPVGGIPQTESAARVAAEAAFPGEPELQLEYMKEWSQTNRTAQ